jgi:cysteine desulfurase/selenocysteine lyase
VIKTVTTGEDRKALRPAAEFDVARIRAAFPVLHQSINGRPLAYLDNAATTQKPRAVIDAVSHYYEHDNANIHRGVHALSMRATEAYEAARGRIARFVGAKRREEIVFVRGATEAINLIAWSFVRPRVAPGDEIVVSMMEHHANIVPWQLLCEATGAVLRVAPINDRGELLLDELAAMLSSRTKVVSVAHVSNALGTINPIEDVLALARKHGAATIVDGAQAVQHMKVDVAALGCDFYVFSGHKMYAPTGIGAMFGRYPLLEGMGPYQGGGDMIKSVSFEGTIYNDVPYRFEAGTPHISGAIGMAAACDFLDDCGLDRIAAHEADLLAYGTALLTAIPGVKIIGTARHKSAVLSFLVDGVHPHDIGTILDQEGVAIRTGNHCAEPVMTFFGVPGTARASLGVYNTREELDALAGALRRVIEVFG